MSNLREVSEPLSAGAFAAFVRFCEEAPHEPKPERDCTVFAGIKIECDPDLEPGEWKIKPAASNVVPMGDVALLMCLGLPDNDILLIKRLARERGQSPVTVIRDMLFASLDLIREDLDD